MQKIVTAIKIVLLLLLFLQERKKELCVKIDQVESQISVLQKDSLSALNKRMSEVCIFTLGSGVGCTNSLFSG